MILKYQQQESFQTLAEAIEEYHSAYRAQLKTRALSLEGEAFFRCHDVVHVIFGCGISLGDEVTVKMSSFFGTTGGLDSMKGYRLAESKEIYVEIGLADIFLTFCTSIVLVPKTIWRCARMHKRWPWDDFEMHLDTPLRDIRESFGIRIS